MRVNTCVCTCVHVSACECVCMRACMHGARSPACVPQTLYLAPSQGTSRPGTGSGLWPPLPDPLGPRPVCGVATAPPAPRLGCRMPAGTLAPLCSGLEAARGQEPQPHAEQSRTSPAYVEARSVGCFRAWNHGQGRNVTHSRWQCHRAQGRETGCWTWRFILRTGVAGKTSIAPGAESGWQGGRGCQKGGAGRGWQPRESGSRGQEAGADTASHPATPPCCAPPLGTHRASASDQRGPRLSFCSRAIGKYLLFVFFFFSSDTLIWDVWQKKKPGPHACCPAKMKVQGLVQTITFLKSYLQKEKFP